MAKRCFGCMQLKEKTPVCEHCGHSELERNKPHQLPIGAVLRGQYLVGKCLGQGGFGITYLGWDQFLDIPVAIKEYFPTEMVTRDSARSTSVMITGMYPPEIYQNFRDRFLREAKTLAKFNNVPEIVRVMGFFEENNTAYIIMDFIPGMDLREYARKNGGRLSARETMKLMKPMIRAIGQVHQAGFVHRDISPDNIMITKEGSAKLLDFGAVRFVENKNPEDTSTQIILKHGFAPPEQYESHGNLGPWTDEYALCATIYYCLTGRIPPDAPKRLLQDTHPQWKAIPGLTQSQAEALEKGMSLRYKERFSTVLELEKALEGPFSGSGGNNGGTVDPFGPTVPNGRRCMSCMRIKKTTGACEYCGSFERANEEDELPLRTVLKNRYLVGRKVVQTHFELMYQGWDMQQQKAVLIREFFCKSIVIRSNKTGTDIRSFVRIPNETEPFRNIFERNKKEYLSGIQLKNHQIGGILYCQDSFQANGTAYIVMNTTGIPLRQYISKRRPGQEETLSLLRPLMDSLQQMHQKHLIYEYVGSENVFVDGRGRAMLLDVPFVGDTAYKTAIYWVEGYHTKPAPRNVAPELMSLRQQREGYGIWTDTYGVCQLLRTCMGDALPSRIRSVVEKGTGWDIRGRYRSIEELEKALQQPWSGKTLSPRSYRG